MLIIAIVRDDALIDLQYPLKTPVIKNPPEGVSISLPDEIIIETPGDAPEKESV